MKRILQSFLIIMGLTLGNTLFCSDKLDKPVSYLDRLRRMGSAVAEKFWGQKQNAELGAFARLQEMEANEFGSKEIKAEKGPKRDSFFLWRKKNQDEFSHDQLHQNQQMIVLQKTVEDTNDLFMSISQKSQDAFERNWERARSGWYFFEQYIAESELFNEWKNKVVEGIARALDTLKEVPTLLSEINRLRLSKSNEKQLLGFELSLARAFSEGLEALSEAAVANDGFVKSNLGSQEQFVLRASKILRLSLNQWVHLLSQGMLLYELPAVD